MQHGTLTMQHGTLTMQHGTLTMYHGTLSMYHGTSAVYHGTFSCGILQHNCVLLVAKVLKCTRPDTEDAKR